MSGENGTSVVRRDRGRHSHHRLCDPGTLGIAIIMSSILDVGIVGAGIAGLAAAYTLSASGLKCQVFEGRPRVGGRVWTQDGVDLGSGRIHGSEENPIYDLCKENKIKMVGFEMENAQLYSPKGEADKSLAKKIDKNWEEISGSIVEKIENLKNQPGVSVLDILAHSIKEAELTSPPDVAKIYFEATNQLVHEHAADLAHLSAEGFTEGMDTGEDDYILPGGFSQIADLLVKEAQKSVGMLLNAPVNTIALQPDGIITLHTADGAIHPCKSVILAVPLGVLKASTQQVPGPATIAFMPPLDLPIQAAISRLGMGLLDKYYVEFPAGTKLPKNIHVFKYFNDPASANPETAKGPQYGFPQMINLTKFTSKPSVVALSAGSDAAKFATMPDAEVLGLLMAQLRQMFGKDTIPEPVRFLRSKWGHDPFAAGSFSFFAVNSKPSDRVALGAPMWGGKLILAGEHVNEDYPGTAQGAFLSGEKAAVLVLQALGVDIGEDDEEDEEGDEEEDGLNTQSLAGAIAEGVIDGAIDGLLDVSSSSSSDWGHSHRHGHRHRRHSSGSSSGSF